MATEKAVMVFGIDESEHSYYALEWTLTHLYNPHFKLFVVHSKPSATASVGLAGPGSLMRNHPRSECFESRIVNACVALVSVLPTVERDLKRSAARVLEKAKEMCASKSVSDVTFEAVEGDARNVLCEAVERHNATMLVLGNHGHGAIKRAVLGSVSDYCAHHAHCTVTIVKKPHTKH